jgi:hypothetical protein
VTQAQARSNQQAESTLGIVFDNATLKTGQEIPLNATIQAVAAAQETAAMAARPDEASLTNESMAGAIGATRSGVVSAVGTVGGATAAVAGTAGAVTAPLSNVGSTVGGTAGSTANAAASASRGAVGGLDAAGQLTSNSQGVFNMRGLNLTSSASTAMQGSLLTSTSRNVYLDSGTQLLLSSTSTAQTQASKQ